MLCLHHNACVRLRCMRNSCRCCVPVRHASGLEPPLPVPEEPADKSRKVGRERKKKKRLYESDDDFGGDNWCGSGSDSEVDADAVAVAALVPEDKPKREKHAKQVRCHRKRCDFEWVTSYCCDERRR